MRHCLSKYPECPARCHSDTIMLVRSLHCAPVYYVIARHAGSFKYALTCSCTHRARMHMKCKWRYVIMCIRLCVFKTRPSVTAPNGRWAGEPCRRVRELIRKILSRGDYSKSHDRSFVCGTGMVLGHFRNSISPDWLLRRIKVSIHVFAFLNVFIRTLWDKNFRVRSFPGTGTE